MTELFPIKVRPWLESLFRIITPQILKFNDV